MHSPVGLPARCVMPRPHVLSLCGRTRPGAPLSVARQRRLQPVRCCSANRSGSQPRANDPLGVDRQHSPAPAAPSAPQDWIPQLQRVGGAVALSLVAALCIAPAAQAETRSVLPHACTIFLFLRTSVHYRWCLHWHQMVVTGGFCRLLSSQQPQTAASLDVDSGCRPADSASAGLASTSSPASSSSSGTRSHASDTGIQLAKASTAEPKVNA